MGTTRPPTWAVPPQSGLGLTDGGAARESPPRGGLCWSVEGKHFLQRPAGLVWPSGGVEGLAVGLKDHRGRDSPQIPFPHLMGEDNES